MDLCVGPWSFFVWRELQAKVFSNCRVCNKLEETAFGRLCGLAGKCVPCYNKTIIDEIALILRLVL